MRRFLCLRINLNNVQLVLNSLKEQSHNTQRKIHNKLLEKIHHGAKRQAPVSQVNLFRDPAVKTGAALLIVSVATAMNANKKV
jgi:hypothetical protein